MSPTVRLTLKPLTALDRIWYWRINETPPLSVASTGPGSARIARLVPHRFRRLRHRYATTHGYYWLPCPLCGREYGGHEGGKTIPDPTRGTGRGVVACAPCSRDLPRYEP